MVCILIVTKKRENDAKQFHSSPCHQNKKFSETVKRYGALNKNTLETRVYVYKPENNELVEAREV